MKATIRWFVVVLAGFAAGRALFAQDNGQPKGPPRVEPTPAARPGDVLEWTDGQGKPFWYRLPKSFVDKKPLTLVLMLHGTGLKWGWAFWNYPIADGTFRGADLVVAPEAMTPGQGDTFNFIQGKADGDHLVELIALLRKRFTIDRVYVYGHSQGAFFAYWFAGEHPDLVDGIVAHAGNVLADVKHPALAKTKVGIGILHGRADAVVPVECALGTERVYREQGYQKLKLRIVEGLTAQSGHWPLPGPVAEMLAWLDSVTSDSPAGVLDSACHALVAAEPDLGLVADALARAARLLKAGTKIGDREALLARANALSAWLDDLAKAQAAQIAARSDSRRTEPEFSAASVQFRLANRMLDGWPAWGALARDLRGKVPAHDRVVSGGLDRLAKAGLKDAGDIAKAVDGGFLSRRYSDLVGQVERALLGAPPKGAKPEEVARLKALIEGRRAAEAEGQAKIRAVTAERVTALRSLHPDWFPGG